MTYTGIGHLAGSNRTLRLCRHFVANRLSVHAARVTRRGVAAWLRLHL